MYMQAKRVVEESCEVLPYDDDGEMQPQPEQAASSQGRAAAKSEMRKGGGMIEAAPAKRRLGQPADREAEVVAFEYHAFFSVVHLHPPSTPSPCGVDRQNQCHLRVLKNHLSS